MAIEIVDLSIKNGDFPVRYVSLPKRVIDVDNGKQTYKVVPP